LLVIETATRDGSVAFLSGDHADAATGAGADAHGERLPGEIVCWLGALGRRIEDVDAVAVVTGPGSFTGLRVGVATAQGISMALGCPVAGVPTLDAVAYAYFLRHDAADVPRVVACLEGPRGDVFAGLFRSDVRAGVVAEAPAVVARPLDVAGRVGDVSSAGAPLVAAGDLDMPIALSAGRLARLRPEAFGRPHDLRILYVRPPDPVVARERAGLPPARLTE
jgi:tRNA threonylcarbamoyl adenosine modification protein YeaZ